MNKTAQAFKELFASARKRFAYFLEGAIIGFTEDIVTRMGELKISKSEPCCKETRLQIQRMSPKYCAVLLILHWRAWSKSDIALDSELEVRFAFQKA